MNWLNDIGSILQQYAGARTLDDFAGVEVDFEQVALAAPKSVLAEGLAEAFRSDRTPPFPRMVAQLFDSADGYQRAALLDLLAGKGSKTRLEETEHVAPEEVEHWALDAERKDPAVVERVSRFCAERPDLTLALGCAALQIAMARIATMRFVP